MKTKKIIFYILMFLPFIIAFIALQFLPEQIPAHYGFDHQVTRFGSKYEILAVPIITFLFGYFFLGIAKFSAKQEKTGDNNENFCLTAGILTLALFNVLSGYILYTSFHKIENLSFAAFDIYQLLFGILGLIMVVIGNIMPKLRMNSVAGLKTRWSIKNEATWKKSQRFGGISYMIGGILIIFVCFLVKGIPCLLLTTGIIAVLLTVDIFYTYRAAKN